MSKGVRLGNWLTARQARALRNPPDATTNKGLSDRAKEVAAITCRSGAPLIDRGSDLRGYVPFVKFPQQRNLATKVEAVLDYAVEQVIEIVVAAGHGVL